MLLYMKVRRTRKKRGGIKTKGTKSSGDAFNDFLHHSMVEILTGSVEAGSGLVFACTLNDGADSQYESMRHHERVKKIIIKLVGVGPEKASWSLTYLKPDENGVLKETVRDKIIEEERTFKNERDVQQSIFNGTMDERDPVCPSIVYFSIEKQSEYIIGLLDKMISRSSDDTVDKLTQFKTAFENGFVPWLGIIGMEIAEGYRSLREIYADFYEGLVSRTDVQMYENMARLRILEMTAKTGYSHNDFHKDNILINTNTKGFYDDLPGHVLLIDFGFACPLSELLDKNKDKIKHDILDEIRDNMFNEQYVEALNVFETLRRPADGAPFNYYPAFGWLYFRYDNTIKSKNVSKAAADSGNRVKKNNIALIALKHKQDTSTNLRTTNVPTKKIQVRRTVPTNN